MKLYFAPLACSMSARISLYEAGVPVEFVQVDTKQRRTADGRDYASVNPMAQVPALELDDGTVITENTAVLQYIAGSAPHASLAPTDAKGRAQLQLWLGFIATELHKAIFMPLFDAKASEPVKAYAREKIAQRMAVLERHLNGREYLLDRFSVADAYLATILNWASATNVDLAQWPAVAAYQKQIVRRSSIARALGEEFAMYKEELARRKA